MCRSVEDPCSDRNVFHRKQSTGFGDGGYTERLYRICGRRIFRMPAVHRNGIRTVLRNFSRFIFHFLSGFISGIFSEKIPGIFRENIPEKAREIPPGLFHGKLYPKDSSDSITDLPMTGDVRSSGILGKTSQRDSSRIQVGESRFFEPDIKRKPRRLSRFSGNCYCEPMEKILGLFFRFFSVFYFRFYFRLFFGFIPSYHSDTSISIPFLSSSKKPFSITASPRMQHPSCSRRCRLPITPVLVLV